jgi:hypothetical protein
MLGDFVEDPQSLSDNLAPDVIEEYLTDEEKYSLVDKGVAGSNSTAIRTTKTAIDDSQDDASLLALVDLGRISTATTKQFSTEEASTMEADLATATEALTLAEKEGRR